MKAFLALVFTVACIVSHAYSQTQSDPSPLGTLYIVSSPAVPSVKLEDIAAKVAQGLNQDPSSPFVVESIYHPDPSKANLDVILAGLRKNQPTHFHPNDEFHFPVLGNSGTFAEKTTFFMAPGDCAVMPHNTNHFLGNIPAANTPWALTVSVFTPNPVELTPTQAPIPTPSPQSTLRQSFATGSFFTLEKTTNLLELAQTGLSSSSNSLQKLYNTDLTSQFLWIVNNDVVNIDFGKAFFAVILNGGCNLVTDPSDPSKSVSISEKDMFLVHKDTAYTLNNAKELVMVLDFEENVELADLLAILRAGASPSGTSAPNYTPTPSAVPSTYVYTTPAYSPTYIPSYAPSYAASYTPTYEATSTYTPTYTATYTPTYTATYTPTYTSTYAPTYTPTYAATYTPTYQATYTATYAATYTPTYTSTYAPTYAATYAPTYAATPTYTVAYTPTGY